MSWDINTPNSGAALQSMSAASIRLLWQKTFDVFEQTEDFLGQFEGDSKDSPIYTTTDTAKGAGMTLNITSRAGYYGRGKDGDNLFVNSADFEVDNIANNILKVDFLRNATSITQRTDEIMGMRGELASGQTVELGKWMGREKSARAFMTFLLKAGPQNKLVSGQPDETTLKTANGLSYAAGILAMGQALKPLGGRPCEVATVRGNPVYKYCVIGSTPGLFSLKQDSDYKLLVKDAMPREKYDENPLFSGGYADIDGHRINEFNPIDHDGYGPVGSPLNPKAFLGAAINPGTVTFDILGGGSAAAAALTNIDYFRFFPNFAFTFLPSDVFTPGSTVQYLLVCNPKNAPTDPGKFGFYSYTTGNNGNKITIVNRLGSAAAGARVTTLGQVTWNTGVWLNLHTDTHPIGATVILANQYGVPIGDTLMLGAGALLRGYGSMRNVRSQWLVDGGFETRKYVTTIFGQCLRTNVRGVQPGFVKLRHAISYPELGLPVVT